MTISIEEIPQPLAGIIGNTSHPELALRILKSLVSEHNEKRHITKEQIEEFIIAIGGPVDDVNLETVLKELGNNKVLKELEHHLMYSIREDELVGHIYDQTSRYERGLVRVGAFINYAYREYEKRKFLLGKNDLNHIRLFEKGLHLLPEKARYLDLCKRRVVRIKRFRMAEIIGAAIVILTLLVALIRINLQHGDTEILAERATLLADQANRERVALEEQNRNAIQQSIDAQTKLEQAIASAEVAQQRAEQAYRNFQQATNRARTAEEQQKEMERLRLLAEKRHEQAIVETRQAEQRLVESRRLNSVTSALTLANKSLTHRTEPLKSQLALQAFELHRKNKGYEHASPIYNALYYAKKNTEGQHYNVLAGHENTRINQIIKVNERYYTIGDDGKLLIWVLTPEGLMPRPTVKRNIYFYQDGEFTIFQSSIDSYYIAALAVNEQNLRMIHTGGQRFLQINPSTDEVIELFLPEVRGKLLRIFPLETGWHIFSTESMVYVVADDPKKIMSSSFDFDRKVQDVVSTGNSYLLLGKENLLSFNPDDSALSTLSIELDLFPTRMVRSSDPSTVAVGFASGNISVINLGSMSTVFRFSGHTSRISDLQFFQEGSRLVSCGYDQLINIWDLANPEQDPIALSDHDAFITSLYTDETNQLLLTGEVDGTLKFYELNPAKIADDLCSVAPGPLTREEWTRLLGEHLEYDPFSCNPSSF